MFKNLKAEMTRHDKKYENIANVLNVDAKTVSNKMTGKSEWTRKEMMVIKAMFPNCTIDYLFDTE